MHLRARITSLHRPALTWPCACRSSNPEKGVRSNVSSAFTECHQRACQTSGIFGPNGRLAGDLKECWADGLCDYELPEFPRVDMS
eukprot:Tamp_21652.p4 GENE.Tamp_21652~~Tamp_21652.p4  ORF type:complete len:100 (+),score=17.54 Tamp_21652:47-301(+)